MTPIDKLADKVLILVLLATLIFMAFSKPIVVNPDHQLNSKLKLAFSEVEQRIRGLEDKVFPAGKQEPVGDIAKNEK